MLWLSPFWNARKAATPAVEATASAISAAAICLAEATLLVIPVASTVDAAPAEVIGATIWRSAADIGVTAAPNRINAIVASPVETPRTVACVLNVDIARLIPVNPATTARSPAVIATMVKVAAPTEAASATVAAVPATTAAVYGTIATVTGANARASFAMDVTIPSELLFMVFIPF